MTISFATFTDQQLSLARELSAQQLSERSPTKQQLKIVAQLLGEGATIPFIARYRKERTHGLDEVQLRAIEIALKSIDALEARRTAILNRLKERQQEGANVPSKVLEAIKLAKTLSLLEELYAPYKSKRISKADQARMAGLGSLADRLRKGQTWQEQINNYLSKEYKTAKAIEDGMIEILADDLASMPSARTRCLEILSIHLQLTSKRKRGVEPESLYVDYYKFTNKLRYLKPHQLMALRRGEKAGILSLKFTAEDERLREWLLRALCPKSIHFEHHPFQSLLEKARTQAYEQRLLPSISRSLWGDALKQADERSAHVFSQNLKSLLLSPPLLKKRVIGIDPGLRTGCKLAVIDEQGLVLQVSLCFTHDNRAKEAPYTIAQLIDKHCVTAVAIGNGTGSREAEKVTIEALSLCRQPAQYAVIDEAGASVYSASEVARLELPDLDVSERGAVSIARRLQDPLAELIKIDPQSVGVGMYQHDLSESVLRDRLAGVVEDAVCSVGADLNTASPQLLSHVASIGPSLANRIVAYRQSNGSFPNRKALLKVKGLGAKTFEQCAGFLRVYGGDNPLDETAVHPEGYPFAQALLKSFNLDRPNHDLKGLFSSKAEQVQLLAEQFQVGQLTLQDRIEALLKAGRDPREELPPPLLRSKALSLNDLETGMILQGNVRNVVDFGAFIDIGVKRDGLIHVSTMNSAHPKKHRINPYNVLKVGQVVEVCITHIDQQRGRISLVLTEAVPH